MEYNTKRKKLMFYDYGRNVYNMIEQAKVIQDRDKRNAAARNIIKVMAIVNPAAKASANYEHKLWDHLMMWSNFELDVDCPYAIEKVTDMKFHPKKLEYQNRTIHFRHYGHLIEKMVKKAVSITDAEERRYMITLIANQMAKDYYDYNQNAIPRDVLNKQLMTLSNNSLSLPENIKIYDRATQLPGSTGGKKKKKKKKKAAARLS